MHLRKGEEQSSGEELARGGGRGDGLNVWKGELNKRTSAESTFLQKQQEVILMVQREEMHRCIDDIHLIRSAHTWQWPMSGRLCCVDYLH